MDTYTVRGATRKITGHYRRPGTRELFCGRPAGAKNAIFAAVTGWKMCTRCVKAEARDRAEAEAVAEAWLDQPTAAPLTAAAQSADRYIAREFPAVAALLNEEARPAADAEADEQFAAVARAVDAVTYAEETGARVETVADVEALYAAQLVTEAEATDGTWRGAWIGEQPTGDLLFALDPTTEQGALFA